MVEFLCTLMGVVAGVAIVASLLPKYADRQKFAATEDPSETARILGIADQLNVISHRVAADVSAHSERVGSISDRLSMPDNIPEDLLASISEIVEANQAMQGQLVDAQKQIAQQSRTIEQTSHQARTDALTGVSNRRALNEFVTNSIEQSRDGTLLGLMLLDIDHFKAFNDNFGHTTGDAVLASFARSIVDYCGGSSYVARYGGEEFAIVLNGRSTEELVSKAAAIRHYVSVQTINYDDLQLKITVSAGLCWLLADDSSQTVYERADTGLYQAKKSGRNCGFWLSSEGWQPFPAVTAMPPKLADLLKPVTTPQASTKHAAAEIKSPSQGARPTAMPSVTADKSRTAVVGTAAAEPETRAEPGLPIELPTQSAQMTSLSTTESEIAPVQPQAEVLDLKTFLGRLDSSVGQLRKAELPGTAFMLEAVGLRHGHASLAIASWSKAVQTVLQNLRGIDVPCLYRPYTLCVFLPSCTLEAGVARAAKIKSLLQEDNLHWNPAEACEKLAVCVASVGVAEDNVSFLNRLELALETAADSSPQEIVTHDGNTCHFLET